MARILITGGSSYFGCHFVPIVQLDHEVVYTFFHNDPLQGENGVALDVRDDTAVSHLIQSWQPEIIVHLAGSNRGEDMGRVICLGAKHITQGAQAVAARLIHFSTDVIFRGDAAPYDETAVPDPVNEYGRAKADAEAIVSTHPNHVILRTSLIYSLKEMDHGTRWIKKALQTEQPVTLFSNQIRNPIHMDTLIQATRELFAHPYFGILNIAGKQPLTRAQFSLRLLDWWQIKQRNGLTIAPSPTTQWPLNCQLNLQRAQSLLKSTLWGVDDILQRNKKE